ncbi:hypothetical protein [Roseivirga seohaensis]|uniref:hypothetical protein n=1 Tax=Roseivirga seohaensis TaxID=1914963 RepID=UPI003BAAE753
MTKDKLEIGVNKLKTGFFALILIGLALSPMYFIDFNNIVAQDIITLSFSTFMCYCSYRYFIKRILMGPIITLTREFIKVKDEDTEHIYTWATIKKVKVEVVTEKNIEGKDVSRTMLSIWTTTKDKLDEFFISDIEMNSDDIRELINSYQNGTAANNVYKT